MTLALELQNIEHGSNRPVWGAKAPDFQSALPMPPFADLNYFQRGIFSLRAIPCGFLPNRLQTFTRPLGSLIRARARNAPDDLFSVLKELGWTKP